MTIRLLRVSIALATIALLVDACGKVDNQQHHDKLQALVTSTPAWVDRGPLGKKLWAFERAFYESRGYLPAWIDGDAPTAQMKDLISQLHYSERHGLSPARYGVEAFEQARERSQTRMRGTRFALESVPELDAKMTYAYLRYAADLLGWDSNSRDIDPNWLTAPKKEDLAARLTTAVNEQKVRDSLEALAPSHPQYKGLQAALEREQQNPTGHVDRIKMNMERWRWAPRDLGDRYILINVPAYQMQVVEGDKPTLAMRVIVGQPDHRTPIFSDEMTYVVFSPYWNIPEEILRNETLPKVVRDPEYLERNHIEVVGTSGKGEPIDPSSIDWSDEDEIKRVRFRQAPGDENALGLVKFIFPNHFDVYLHDTPTDTLFNKPQRALSHGCIRVEEPVALAKYVMRDRPEWTDERIGDAMHANREQPVKLKTMLPVHIGYWTAWVEPDGKTVTYTDDPYGYDRAQSRLIAAKSSKTNT